MKIVSSILSIFFVFSAHGQGYNHEWLLGSQNLLSVPKGRMFIDSTSSTVISEFRKMPFYGTQGNICDRNGTFLMSSNGIWIANANNDTMMNGGGLNPGQVADDWPNGLPMIYNNVFLPFPGDSSRYALIHHAATFNGSYFTIYELFMSTIDITADSGLGAVIQKNNIILNDTLNCGIAACRHANGRDWWIVSMKDSTNIIFKFLLTPAGITFSSFQNLNYQPIAWGNASQLTFSKNGEMLCANTYDPNSVNSSGLLFDFDRCTGIFSNTRVIPLTTSSYIWGLAFSTSGQYLYACSSQKIFQIDTDSLTVDTVAFYDGFYSPDSNCCPTTFWNMYLAANGKIYITSGSGVQHIHEINFPDSAGQACDVQQHSINLGIYNLRAVPNHPNYYLGPLPGSGCDSLTSVSDFATQELKFEIMPNPVSDGHVKIIYMLPGNSAGVFSVFDMTGRNVFNYPLPVWSTLQHFSLSGLPNGFYNATLISGDHKSSKAIEIIN